MDIVTFSHLRWDFVFQRPQHILRKCALSNRVYFMEEPIYVDHTGPRLVVSPSEEGVTRLIPELPSNSSVEDITVWQQRLLERFLAENDISCPVLWYYNPLAVNFAAGVPAAAVVYDCMDELTAFRGAPAGLRAAEQRLFDLADLVFTGGRSLYASKRHSHHSVHLYPSSVDTHHFAQARRKHQDPVDQKDIARPRIGYSGVIDERMDLTLLDAVSQLRPEWQFVLLGPIAKISHEELPCRENLHFIGAKSYADLPKYLSGWDVAMLPFARNESTRFISPTKTPEYLAAGLPTVSTAIADVVSPYEELGLVRIANEPADFVDACQQLMDLPLEQRDHWRSRVDHFLDQMSWDRTWSAMWSQVGSVISERRGDGATLVGNSQYL